MKNKMLGKQIEKAQYVCAIYFLLDPLSTHMWVKAK